MRDEAPFTDQTAWDQLRIFLDDFASLFGNPATLARREGFQKHEHTVGIAWLRALEAWLRRLILIAAARITPAPPREANKRPARKTANAGAGAANEDSADWRVSFRLHASQRRPTRAKRRRNPRPRRFYNPIPLALRFEALLRAAQNPERYVARMARDLAKNAALPNTLFHQKLNAMSALRPYVAQCSLLMLETFPDAWRRADTS